MTVAPLRVAAGQAESVPGEVETNVATAVRLVAEAAARGARVLVLPELFLTGYAPETWTHDGSLTPEDPRLVSLADVARDGGVVVVAGAAIRRALGASTLSVLVVDARGGVTAPYDKQHVDADERFFTTGDHGTDIVVDGWRLGLGICYDGCVPEHAMAAATAGATAYLCSAASYVGSEHRRDLPYAARALDNGIYVVIAGLTGSCGRSRFSGGSAVYDPEGRPVSRLGDEPGLVVVDLDPGEVRQAQRRHPTGADRLATQGPRLRVEVS